MMNTVIYPDRPVTVKHSVSHVSAVSTQILQTIVESIDGAMILTKSGELVASSFNARQICTQFTQQLTHNLSRAPQKIWNCCQSLIEEQLKSIDEEVKTDQAVAIRIRACWLAADYVDQPHLLVMLEDQHQVSEYRAKTEARKYSLTERETQVWVLKRTGHSYKSIAAQLHIAEDTVKKHIKAIHAKREVVEFE